MISAVRQTCRMRSLAKASARCDRRRGRHRALPCLVRRLLLIPVFIACYLRFAKRGFVVSCVKVWFRGVRAIRSVVCLPGAGSPRAACYEVKYCSAAAAACLRLAMSMASSNSEPRSLSSTTPGR